MRLLFCGDVVGKAGRQVLAQRSQLLRQHLALDAVIVNGENAAHGKGITRSVVKDLFEAGADVITCGNHTLDRQKDALPLLIEQPRILRPLNYPARVPGSGQYLLETGSGQRVLVMGVMGRVFMEPVNDPFEAVDRVLQDYELGRTVDAIVVDVHAEATSEKQCLGHYLNGRVSLVAGTHTHVPTADAKILSAGTAYISDVGMCGDYDSSIGMDKTAALDSMLKRYPSEKHKPAEGPGTLCGVLLETDAAGRAVLFEPVRRGHPIGGSATVQRELVPQR